MPLASAGQNIMACPVDKVLWNSLLGFGTQCHYEPGEVLYLQDTESEGIFCIVQGRVKNCLIRPDGAEVVLTLYGENSILCEVSPINQWTNITSAVAQTSVDAVLIAAKQVRGIICRYPELALLLIQSIGKKLWNLTRQMSELASAPVPKCLAKTLVSLEGYGIKPRDGWYRITHNEIAGLIGTTRPNVTSILNGFAHQGYIQLRRGRIRILKEDDLIEFADT